MFVLSFCLVKLNKNQIQIILFLLFCLFKLKQEHTLNIEMDCYLRKRLALFQANIFLQHLYLDYFQKNNNKEKKNFIHSFIFVFLFTEDERIELSLEAFLLDEIECKLQLRFSVLFLFLFLIFISIFFSIFFKNLTCCKRSTVNFSGTNNMKNSPLNEQESLTPFIAIV